MLHVQNAERSADSELDLVQRVDESRRRPEAAAVRFASIAKDSFLDE
jgi:hypothetical protein